MSARASRTLYFKDSLDAGMTFATVKDDKDVPSFNARLRVDEVVRVDPLVWNSPRCLSKDVVESFIEIDEREHAYA